MDLQGALEHLLEGKPLVPQKVHYSDSNYVSPGPYPFVCGSCRFITIGSSIDPENAQQASEDPNTWGDFCQRVHGPYDSGQVAAEDSCRFWKHKEEFFAAQPIAHEFTGYHVGSMQEAGDNSDAESAPEDASEPGEE